MWKLSDQESDSLINSDAGTRYQYFVKRVADHELVWSIWKDHGWLLMADHSGKECIPVWPHEKYAQLCATGAWDGATAREIALDEWMESWLPGIASDKKLVAVFPTPQSKGVVISALTLLDDLNTELENY